MQWNASQNLKHWVQVCQYMRLIVGMPLSASLFIRIEALRVFCNKAVSDLEVAVLQIF